jgi:hypothetical protein
MKKLVRVDIFEGDLFYGKDSPFAGYGDYTVCVPFPFEGFMGFGTSAAEAVNNAAKLIKRVREADEANNRQA